MEKKFVAIGHYKGENGITSVAGTAYNVKDFRKQLIKNDFVQYVVISEKMLNRLLDMIDNEDMSVFNQVEKMTNNYRKWNDITDYIMQCSDIMVERMEKAH